MRFLFQRIKTVDAGQRGFGRIEGVLDAQDFLHRRHHEPQITEHRQHLPDAEIGIKYHQHRAGAKYVKAEQEYQKTQTRCRIAFPGESGRKILNRPGRFDQLLAIMFLAIAGAYLMDGFQRFSQGLLKNFVSGVFPGF